METKPAITTHLRMVIVFKRGNVHSIRNQAALKFVCLKRQFEQVRVDLPNAYGQSMTM
jgi:hypothetical protein